MNRAMEAMRKSGRVSVINSFSVGDIDGQLTMSNNYYSLAIREAEASGMNIDKLERVRDFAIEEKLEELTGKVVSPLKGDRVIRRRVNYEH